MSCSAFVDESEPSSRSGSAGAYLLAATLVDEDRADEVSSAVTALRLTNQRKLHWHAETDKRRHVLADRVAELPVRHLVIECTDPYAASERRRRLCLRRLLLELDVAGVESVCLESRHTKQNGRDLKLLGVMHACQELGSALRMHHQPGHANPLLWIPDVIAGAAGARLRGDDSFFRPLGAATTYYQV